jgi:hypothetical protein
MRIEPLRVAAWCAVILAALVFIAAVRQMAGTAEAPPVPPARSVTQPPLPPEQPAALYMGNTNTHKFHRSTCRYATCKNCTARFETRDEAITAGFRPGGCCDP